MNADQMLMRLRSFSSDTPLLVAVPLGPNDAGSHRLLPIDAVHHHGLAPEEIDHERALEIFTTPWEAEPLMAMTATIGEVCSRLDQHHEDAHVRVGVPT